ncbi:MAG: LuxR family transcriptional regulator [Pseudonocardiales bacterium]|nr:MAG: LuxR family transcriptional regulator [Pseudonocardiales bacterium]
MGCRAGAGDGCVTGLVEREAEVRALERSLADLAAGRGGVVVVDAAPGLGKTVLLRHARDLALAAGFRVLSARGAELEHDFTFGVVRQLFEPALPKEVPARERLFTGAAGTTAGLFTTIDAISPSGDTSNGTAGSLYPLLNGLYWLLVNLAETESVVVLVDDAQWVDLPSLQFLGFLARRMDSVAVTVIITTRTGEHSDDGVLHDILVAEDATLLEPQNLSISAVAELVRRELGPDADDEFCAACQATTTGNPLFVRELLRVLVTDNVCPDAAAAASVEAAGPGAIRRHVAARLQRQPEAAQVVARVVAVLGDNTDLALVAQQANLPLPVIAAGAERLIRYGIFERADPPAFVHAVVRDVVLSLIPAADRSAEHERAATVLLAAGGSVERVASHLLRTAPSANQDRVGLLLAAADLARQRGSPEGAAVYLLRARNEPPPPAQRSEISRLLGNCQAYQLAFADAETHLREALSLAATPAQRALCAYSLARFRNACGEPGDAVDLLLQATSELPADHTPALTMELEAELIGTARVDLTRRALLIDRLRCFRPRSGRYDAVVQAHLSMEALLSGDPADHAVALARAALAGGQLAPERSAIWVAIHTLVVTDHLDEAQRHLHQALDTAIKRGLLFPIGPIRGYLARVALLRGDLPQAQEHVDLGTAAASVPHFALPLLHSTAVHLMLEHGRLAEADAVVEAGVLSGSRQPRSFFHLWLLDARARLRAAQGDTEAALTDAMCCGRLYAQWGSPRMPDVPWRLRAAEALLDLGDRDRAASLVDDESQLAQAFTVSRHIAVALRSAALLGGTAEARRLLQEAVDLLQDGPARLELARTLEHLGERHLQDGDRRSGREATRRAAELALECHATAMVDRLRARLTAGGGRPPRLRVSGVHALTPSERQVAQLTASALTNRQIAERLFVTEKTVEAHLSRVYRKMGVSSRTQLAVHLAAEPGPPAAITQHHSPSAEARRRTPDPGP